MMTCFVFLEIFCLDQRALQKDSYIPCVFDRVGANFMGKANEAL